MGVWNPGPGATGGNDTFTGDGTDESANGLAGDDTLNGNGGADTLTGGEGSDIVHGGAGNDILIVNENDTVGLESYNGGADFDTLRLTNVSGNIVHAFTFSTVQSIERIEFQSLASTFINAYFNITQISAYNVVSGPGGDSISFYGTAGNDIINLSSLTFTNWDLNDRVYGIGEDGNDTITGTTVADTLIGYGDSDTLNGAVGDDVLQGETGDDFLYGGDDVDALLGGDGADFLRGDAGNDYLVGGDGGDTLAGSAGIDRVQYYDATAGVTVNLETGIGQGNFAQGDTYVSIEIVEGSSFNDTLIGRNYVNNVLDGGNGDDILMGGYGADDLLGGLGFDLLSYENSLTAVDIRLFSGFAAGGEATGDVYSSIEGIIGSAFTDVLVGNTVNNLILGGAGNETINGREGNDYLWGDDGNDTVLGGADTDYLYGSLGNDTLGGGAGNDLADYSFSNAGINVNLATGAGLGGYAQGDTLVSIEDVFGSNFDDVIIGKANFWDNWFDGNGGNDTLTGGNGNDTFVFRVGDGNDTVTDFMAGGASGDVIQFYNWGAAFDTFAEVMAVGSQAGADVVFNFGGQTLTLQNVTLGNLNAGDFLFGTG